MAMFNSYVGLPEGILWIFKADSFRASGMVKLRGLYTQPLGEVKQTIHFHGHLNGGFLTWGFPKMSGLWKNIL